MSLLRWPGLARSGLLFTLSLGLATAAFGQDDPPPPGPLRPGGGLPLPGGEPPPPPPDEEPPPRRADLDGPVSVTGNADGTSLVAAKHVPCVQPSAKVTMDFASAPLLDVVKYMAEITCRNFILQDELNGKVTIISHQQVRVSEAYEAFLSALEVAGYTTVTVGNMTKVVPTSSAANHPLKIYEGGDIPGTDNYVTQIITLDNVSVGDISSVVKEVAGGQAKIVAYQPTNTLIITDSAYNIRRVYRIVTELDVAAPRSKLEVIPLRYATAADVEKILEEMFGLAATTTSTSTASSATSRSGADSSNRRRRRDEQAAPAASTGASATAVGSNDAYISKIISDERTNALIVMANEEALQEMMDLIARIDVDIDPASRAQIHVVYLENAKATDISGVLTDLVNSSGSSSGSSSSSSSSSRNRNSSGGSRSTSGSRPTPTGQGGGNFPRAPGGAEGGSPSSLGSAAKALEGVRITADEATNSLVIVASPEDYRTLKGVIDKLDIMRRQVFVEAVVLEVGSTDSDEFSIGAHSGIDTQDGGFGFGNATLGGSGSLGLYTGLASALSGSGDSTSAADLLSGLAMGVFGKSLDLELGGETVSIPAFGLVVNALASNSAVDILSNPSLLILDNEEATINVGRNVPFPVSSGRDNNNNPIVSYQREDVGITLKVTPQINEANFVTLELGLEVAEVEEDSSGLDVTTAGFITSKRETENVVVVKDNQTVVIGGLIGNTETEVMTKVPILGDIPLLGVLFRGKRNEERKTNLLIFLTPHVINEPTDLEEVYRVKWAQRAEFMRRFYGRSRDEQEQAMEELLRGSMNLVDEPSQYRDKAPPVPKEESTGSMLAPSSSSTPTTTPDDTGTTTGGN